MCKLCRGRRCPWKLSISQDWRENATLSLFNMHLFSQTIQGFSCSNLQKEGTVKEKLWMGRRVRDKSAQLIFKVRLGI